jgi:hypothetical protein
MKNVLCAVFAGCFLSIAVAGCVTSSDPDGTMSEEQAQATVHRITESELAALPDGELLTVDITSPDIGYEIHYTDTRLLDRVLVRTVEGEYVLGKRAAELGIQPTGEPSRFILASDPDLAQDIMVGAEPSVQPQAIYVCDECHWHSGGILHCTGCVKIQN